MNIMINVTVIPKQKNNINWENSYYLHNWKNISNFIRDFRCWINIGNNIFIILIILREYSTYYYSIILLMHEINITY